MAYLPFQSLFDKFEPFQAVFSKDFRRLQVSWLRYPIQNAEMLPACGHDGTRACIMGLENGSLVPGSCFRN